MGGFSLWHILIFAVIVLLLFGGNRFSAMMGDVAKGLKSFKQGMADDDVRPGDRSPDQRALPREKPVDLYPSEPNPTQPTSPQPTTPPSTDDSVR